MGLNERELSIIHKFLDGEKKNFHKLEEILKKHKKDDCLEIKFLKAYFNDDLKEYSRLKKEIRKSF